MTLAVHMAVNVFTYLSWWQGIWTK